MDFYSIFLAQCAKKGSTPSAAASAIGLSNAAATGWKNGKQPSAVTLAKLANYFGCDITDLTVQKEKPAQESGPNKDMLLAWIENAGRDELIEALQAVTKKLSEK